MQPKKAYVSTLLSKRYLIIKKLHITTWPRPAKNLSPHFQFLAKCDRAKMPKLGVLVFQTTVSL